MLDFEMITKNWDKPINRNDESSYTQIYNLFQAFNAYSKSRSWSFIVLDIRQNLKINVFAKFWDVKPTDLLT